MDQPAPAAGYGGNQMHVLMSLALAGVAAVVWPTAAFAQNASTTCTTYRNTTYCNTATSSSQQSGGESRGPGAFVDSFTKGWDAAQRLAEQRALLRQQRLQIEQQEAPVEQQRQLTQQQTASPPQSTPTATPTPRPQSLSLACRLETIDRLQSVSHVHTDGSYYVDPAAGTVNGWPANITDSQIRFKDKTSGRADLVIIDRATGDISVLSNVGIPSLAGNCALSTARKF